MKIDRIVKSLSIICVLITTMIVSRVQAETNYISGYLYGNHKWVASNTYILNGFTYVMNNAVLDIEAGTVVKGASGSGTSAAIGILIAISGTISMISSGAIFATVNSPLSFGYFNLAGFLVFVPVTMLMAPLGAKVVHKVSRSLITKIFGIYLILISLRSFIEYLNIK